MACSMGTRIILNSDCWLEKSLVELTSDKVKEHVSHHGSMQAVLHKQPSIDNPTEKVLADHLEDKYWRYPVVRSQVAREMTQLNRRPVSRMAPHTTGTDEYRGPHRIYEASGFRRRCPDSDGRCRALHRLEYSTG